MERETRNEMKKAKRKSGHLGVPGMIVEVRPTPCYGTRNDARGVADTIDDSFISDNTRASLAIGYCIGLVGDALVDGMLDVFDYGDTLCRPPADVRGDRADNPSNSAKEKADSTGHSMSTKINELLDLLRSNEVSDKLLDFVNTISPMSKDESMLTADSDTTFSSDDMEYLASTLLPESRDLSEKMDELLKLVKKNELSDKFLCMRTTVNPLDKLSNDRSFTSVDSEPAFSRLEHTSNVKYTMATPQEGSVRGTGRKNAHGGRGINRHQQIKDMQVQKKNAHTAAASNGGPTCCTAKLMSNEKAMKSTSDELSSAERQPMFADFNPGVEAKSSSQWEATFGGDNPFSITSITRDDAADSLESRVCAWCGKGGPSNVEVARKLKVCSMCDVTFYCSRNCQNQDWLDNHAQTCQATWPKQGGLE